MPHQSVRLTSNAGETDVSTLLGNSAVFEIPFFQRPYKWGPNSVKQLRDDILDLVDGSNDLHFIGAIIVHGLPSNPADPKVYEVIDGQQRLTTLYLHVCAAVKTLVDHDEFEEAENLFRKYLVTNVSRKGRSNLTLHPSKEDRSDLNSVIREVLENRGFGKKMEGFTFHPLSEPATRSGRITNNFKLIKAFYAEQAKNEGVDQIRQVYSCLLQRISIVQIDVQDPTNGPKIFDSLNSRQEPMTVGDLVRNDVFLKVVSADPYKASSLEEHCWQPFYDKFQKTPDKDQKKSQTSSSFFDAYFFPFGLIKNPNLKKSEVYAYLKKDWDKKDPETVIEQLAEYQDSFLDLVKGTDNCGHEKKIALRFRRMHDLGAPSSTYPFLMRLSRELSLGTISIQDGIQILDLIDSFLTRRALSGHEPTGLHAVFKGLWEACAGNVTAENVMHKILAYKTVTWPGDADVAQAISTRSLYKSSIDRYFILQFEESLAGDKVPASPFVEHVLPSNFNSDWNQFTAEDHKRWKDTLPNLLPLSGSMNSSLGCKGYSEKRPTYSKDSMYKTARMFAEEYDQWNPANFQDRGTKLSAWAIKRWPYRPD